MAYRMAHSRRLPAIVSALFLIAGAGCSAGVKGGDTGSGGSNGTGSGGSGGSSSSGGQKGGGGSTTTGGGGDSSDGPGCNDKMVDFTPHPPTIVLLVDRSSSMSAQYGTSTRWDALKSVILQGLVMPLQDQVRFGLTTYTAPQTGACPLLQTVDPKLNNYTDISAVYSSDQLLSGKGETPTADAIRAVTASLGMVTDPGAKAIVLATDGEPDGCGPLRDPQCGQDDSVAAIQDAFTAGIRTFIVGVTESVALSTANCQDPQVNYTSMGNNVSDCHLQDIANAGAGLPVAAPPPGWKDQCNSVIGQNYMYKGMYVARSGFDYTSPMNAPFYHPTDTTKLTTALTSIIAGIRGCTFTMGNKIMVADANRGKVLLDGNPITFNDPNGWKVIDDMTIEIDGTSCETIKSGGTQSLYISFPCDVIVQ